LHLLQRLFAARLPQLMLGDSMALVKREEGQTLAEYALILALIAVIAVVALIFLGGTITGLFSKVGNSV
jgi:pilus assembly protein Flp/PilA